MAAESYWFKINPEKYLSIAARIPDGTQRAEFLAICMHCLAAQGPLPNDDEEIAFITAIAIDRIKALRPYLNRLCRAEDGQIIPTLAEDTIAERREFSEKQASNGRSGGKKTQAQPSEAQAPSSTAKAPLDDTQAIQTDKQTNKQARQKPARVASPDPISNALEEVYPGSATNFRAMREMFELATSLGATDQQIRGFPAWLKEHYPRKANGPFTFRDLFPESLKNGNGRAAVRPSEPKYNCAKCKDLGIFTRNGKPSRCDCWQLAEVV